MVPSDAGTCARRIPSKCAPTRSIAAREPRVASVGLERDALRFPDVERVAEHEQLGLGVHRRALCRCRQPGGADLRRARDPVGARWWSTDTARLPVVEVEEARAADDRTVAGARGDERQRPSQAFVLEHGLDVGAHARLVLRHGSEAVRRAILARCRDEAVDVVVRHRAQRHHAACEHHPFGHADIVLATPACEHPIFSTGRPNPRRGRCARADDRCASARAGRRPRGSGATSR